MKITISELKKIINESVREALSKDEYISKFVKSKVSKEEFLSYVVKELEKIIDNEDIDLIPEDVLRDIGLRFKKERQIPNNAYEFPSSKDVLDELSKLYDYLEFKAEPGKMYSSYSIRYKLKEED